MIRLFSKLLKKEAQKFVSINLGSHYLKGLIVEEARVSDYFLEENKDLPRALKELWQRKKIPTERVRVSLKSPSALIRYFTFPKIDKGKLREALFYELNKHIPFSADDVYFDFTVLEEASPTENFLLLAAAKKDFIENILDIFEAAGLKVLEVSLDSVCLINLFLQAYRDEKTINSCLLDMGYSSSTVTVFKEKIPNLTRDLECGTKDIFQIVSHQKDVSPAEIEDWLSFPKNLDEFFRLAEESLSSLGKELKNSFDYFELNKGERIEKIYLTGGLANLTGIDSFFRDLLGIPSEILDNFQKLKFSFPQGNFKTFKNSLSVAAGLAL